jgi:photosystem II stability/assembly factor-like uncharacterized protein
MVSIFLATTSNGLVRAQRDTGGGWSVAPLLVNVEAQCLASNEHHPQVVYAGTRGHGVWRSLDQGATWHPAGLQGNQIKALAISRASPEIVYAGTKPACLYVTRDGGGTWTELTAFRQIPSRRFWVSPAEKPFTGYVQAIALSPTDPDTLVVGIEFGAVVRSQDGGRTWTDHRSGALRDCHSLVFHASNGDWAYEAGGSGAGVAVSQTAGNRWTQPGAGLRWHYGWAVAADPAEPSLWYASVAPGALKAHRDRHAEASIVRMTEGGRWQTLAGGLPQPLTSMPYALLTDPGAPGHVYAGLGNGEVWHSPDAGEHWTPLPFTLGSIARALIGLRVEERQPARGGAPSITSLTL